VSILSRLFSRTPAADSEAVALWQRIVEVGRDKRWYLDRGVADNVAGRFDAIALVLALVMIRMEGDEALIEPSARVTELFVQDMDGQLRQSGVGDLVVGKRVSKLLSVLGGRIAALRTALAAEDPEAALVPVLERNVTLREAAGGAERRALASAVVRLHGELQALAAPDVMAGNFAR